MLYVINGTLQREFLTRLSFALGVDANARLVVRLVQMIAIEWSLSLMLQCDVNIGTLQQEFLICLSFGLARV